MLSSTSKSVVGGGPVTPGGQYKTNSANATTPGTGKLQPRQPGQQQARPTTPRRLSPINTSTTLKGQPDQSFKGTLSPKASHGKTVVKGTARW